MAKNKTKENAELYWFITGTMDVTCEWLENGDDVRRRGVQNYFKTKEEAEKVAHLFKVILKELNPLT